MKNLEQLLLRGECDRSKEYVMKLKKAEIRKQIINYELFYNYSPADIIAGYPDFTPEEIKDEFNKMSAEGIFDT